MTVAFFDAKSYDIENFRSRGEKANINFRFFDTRLFAETAALASSCDGVCVFVNDDLGRETINALLKYNIKFAVLRCAGFNNVDINSAKGRLFIKRTPEYSPHAVAEHAAALLLCSIRRIHKAYCRTRDFNFSLEGLTGVNLHGKTAGIIGAGKIGGAFINICRGFGMRVIYNDISPRFENFEYYSLEELLSKSDIISLHCPLNKDTRHIINDNTIKLIKKDAMIINTSRGALIDAHALLAAIKERRLGGACLDVYEEESETFFEDRSGHILEDDVLARLISMPNVIVTSHQGFLTKEALENIAETTIKNILNYKTAENSIF